MDDNLKFKKFSSAIDDELKSLRLLQSEKSEICVKFKYNDEKRQFFLTKPIEYSKLIELINTKIDVDIIPYYTLNDGEFLCPLENQTDLDYAILICEKESLAKPSQNIKLNLQLVKTVKDVACVQPTSLTDTRDFISEKSHDSFIKMSKKTNYNEGFFIPDEDSNEFYRETSYSETNVFSTQDVQWSPIDPSYEKNNNDGDLVLKENRFKLKNHCSDVGGNEEPKFKLRNLSIANELSKFEADGSAMVNNNSDGDESTQIHVQKPEHWKLGRVIGRGGFGTVNLCSDLDTGRILAVKHVVLDPYDSHVEKAIKMLKLEIDTLKKISHDRIVQYYGSTTVNSELYIFVEYMPGGSVREKIDQYGPLSESVVRKYTKQILEGLDYLHSNYVIHRDVKGSNVLCDTNGNVKLCDFGASKYMKEIASKSKTLKSEKYETYIGTCHFMSPEIIKSEKYGRKVDIWSLGCTIVEMFTGKPPWADLQQMQLFYRFIINESPQYVLPQNTSQHAKEFLDLAFCLNYQNRPNAKSLLNHRFLN